MPSCPLACLPGRTPVSPPTLARLLACPPARPPARPPAICPPAICPPARPPPGLPARSPARVPAHLLGRPLTRRQQALARTCLSEQAFRRWRPHCPRARPLPPCGRAPLASLARALRNTPRQPSSKLTPFFRHAPDSKINVACRRSQPRGGRSTFRHHVRRPPTLIRGHTGGRKTTRKKGVSFDEGCSRKRTGRGTRWIIAVLLEP